MDYLSFSDELKRLIRKRLNDLADLLAQGGCQDYAQYKEVVGQITGLAEAEALLLHLRSSFDQEQ